MAAGAPARHAHLAQVRQTLQALQGGLQGTPAGGAFEVDASAMAEFDTSALAACCWSCAARRRRAGCSLAVLGAPPKLHAARAAVRRAGAAGPSGVGVAARAQVALDVLQQRAQLRAAQPQRHARW
jgi:hypothetical protein